MNFHFMCPDLKSSLESLVLPSSRKSKFLNLICKYKKKLFSTNYDGQNYDENIKQINFHHAGNLRVSSHFEGMNMAN